MRIASFLVPLVTCVDAGKGDLPTVSDADFQRQTTSSRQPLLSACAPARCRIVDRTAPAPAVGEISCMETI
jgi:hypothetical protein